MQPSRILDEMPHDELIAWLHFHRLEPWHEERADLHNAQLMSLLANVNRNPKKQRRPYKPEDFLVRWEPKRVHGRKPLTSSEKWAQLSAEMRAANRARASQ